MCSKDFGERWRSAHPNDVYLAPFLGGPVDEIFLKGTKDIGNSSRISCHRRLQSGYEWKDDPVPNPCPVPKTRPVSIPDVDNLTRMIDCWVRVSNVPERVYHLTYIFFSRLGTLQTMRVFNENTFYLLYKDPRDTKRALSFNGKTVSIFENTMTLHVELEESNITNIYSRRYKNHRDGINEEDSNCTEHYIYEDEYPHEYFDYVQQSCNSLYYDIDIENMENMENMEDIEYIEYMDDEDIEYTDIDDCIDYEPYYSPEVAYDNNNTNILRLIQLKSVWLWNWIKDTIISFLITKIN